MRSMVLLVLVTSGSILGLNYYQGQQIVSSLSKEFVTESVREMRSELDHFFGSVEDQVLIAQEWASHGLLDSDNPEDLTRIFQPLLKKIPQISSMMVTRSNGTGYLLLKDANHSEKWMTRVVRVGDTESQIEFKYWNEANGQVRTETKTNDYDPRNRIWYKGAMNTQPTTKGKQVYWTPPVIFYTTRDPGITAGSHYSNAHGESIVIAFDLLLLDISRLSAQKVSPSENGTVFVLHEDMNSSALSVVGLPKDPSYTTFEGMRKDLTVMTKAKVDTPARLRQAEEFQVGPVSSAVKTWEASGKDGEAVFPFEKDGLTWWAGFRPYQLGDNKFWLCVAIPESDFLSTINTQRNRILIISILALIIALVLSVILSIRLGKPIEKLVLSSRQITALDLRSLPKVDSDIREISELAISQKELAGAMDSFVRYVPLEVVGELIQMKKVASIGGETQTLTILFTDIQGFTEISEKMLPQDLAEHMKEYFDLMLNELKTVGATVDKFVGDAIVAFWGAPLSDPNQVKNALNGVIACSRELEKKNREWEQSGRPMMRTRFGLTVGEVTVGNIGAEHRLSYTVLGDKVNLAARLEGINKLYGTEVMAPEELVLKAGDEYLWRRVDRVAVKGKTEGIDIYELLGTKGDVSSEKLQFAKDYETGLKLFQESEFEKSEIQLNKLKKNYPDDKSILRLLESIALFKENPPPESWDGTIRILTKG